MRLRLRRTLRATKIALRDPRIPRPLRWGGTFGLLPVPGPVDEAALLLVASILAVFYRAELAEAWRLADRDAQGAESSLGSPGQMPTT